MMNQLSPSDMRLFREMAQWFRQKRGEGDRNRSFVKATVLNQAEKFLVRMEKTGGVNGTDELANTYVYNVYRKSTDVLLEAGIQLNYGSRHTFWTFDAGEVDPATEGEAYFNDEDQLIIYWCNEHDRRGPCEDACVDDPNCGEPGQPLCMCQQPL